MTKEQYEEFMQSDKTQENIQKILKCDLDYAVNNDTITKLAIGVSKFEDAVEPNWHSDPLPTDYYRSNK
jgi:hypothetical protein